MTDTSITEKTLELNLCEEILAFVRKSFPRAFWFGPSTREEKAVGYDASLQRVDGHVLFLQFKRPLKYTPGATKTFPYWFTVKSSQHKTLLDLAMKYPGAVNYAFSLIGDHEQLIQAAPNLTDETFYALAETTRHLDDPPAHHNVEVYPDRAIFHSEPVSIPRRSLPEIVQAMIQHKLRFNEFTLVHEGLRRNLGSFAGTAPNGYDIIEFELPRVLFAPISQAG